MEGKTLIFVVLSGLCFLPACFPRIYILVEKAKTWTEAQNYCREKYTDLASVENEEEYKQLMAASQKYYSGHLWTGLYGDRNSWRWSLEKKDSNSEGEAEFRMWKPGEPSNERGYENCAGMAAGGFWEDWLCTDTAQFVCYHMTSSSFIYVNESKTWSEAQSYCREHYTDLASVRNQAENDQIENMNQNRSVWIGLYRDSWKWSDGSPTSFTYWNNNEPNGDYACAVIHNGRWEDYDCDTTLYFVCEIVPVKQQVVRVKVTKQETSVNLEDAAEAILKQLTQTLKDNGLSEDIKLTWRKQPDGKIFYLEEKEENKQKMLT
ncbi:macrophage mannose receptor 1-like isoform X2 [Dicentrarchus labrax]|uniref:macrophage mannose receptor 1-like isoform X2 n=1 Tax=Dicentrarchus labrax TaxID=13489 RepID=UPI0021F51FB5|nr:macrophage mannose receptor 1-like isoform X2 [Dicentrarchus labrax]